MTRSLFTKIACALLVLAIAQPLAAQTDSRATFTVQKLFMDGNDEQDVELNISCNTGLPLKQTVTAGIVPGPLGSPQTYEVKFVVESFKQGELDCTVSETENPDYLASYNCDIDVGGECDTGDPSGIYESEFYLPVDSFYEGPCVFTNVDTSTGPDEKPWETLCVIRNYPAPVDVNIHKDWVVDGVGGNEVDYDYRVTLWCDSPIINGDVDFEGDDEADNPAEHNELWYLQLDIWGPPVDADLTGQVIPRFPQSTCWVEEQVKDSSIEITNGCFTPFNVSLGSGHSCTITNTVFFEGIPTLGDTSKLLMALMLLGLGLVAYRRFS